MNSKLTEQKRLELQQDRKGLLTPSGHAWPKSYDGHSESYSSVTSGNKWQIDNRTAWLGLLQQAFDGIHCQKCGQEALTFVRVLVRGEWVGAIHCAVCGWCYERPRDADAKPVYVLTKVRDYGSCKCKERGCKVIIEHRKSGTHRLCPKHQAEHRRYHSRTRKP